jgi:hypothetical protein
VFGKVAKKAVRKKFPLRRLAYDDLTTERLVEMIEYNNL